MALELVKDKWVNAVSTLAIGATKEEGGTRAKTLQCGAQESL